LFLQHDSYGRRIKKEACSGNQEERKKGTKIDRPQLRNIHQLRDIVKRPYLDTEVA
jgi:hypothetical protein